MVTLHSDPSNQFQGDETEKFSMLLNLLFNKSGLMLKIQVIISFIASSLDRLGLSVLIIYLSLSNSNSSQES